MGILDDLSKGVSKNVYYNAANQAVMQGRYIDAIAAYEQAIKADPNFLEAHFNLGFLLMNMGNYDRSIAEFDTVLRMFPNYPDAHNNRGFCLEGKGMLNEAAEEYKKAIALRPDHPTPHMNLQRCLGKIQMAGGAGLQAPVPVPHAQPEAHEPQVIIKETIKEIVKIPCKYCGTLVEITCTRCPSCNAPLK